MAKNENLRKAKDAKNDEFYTQLSDIERELRHYKEHFKGKTVFCNCDDPYESNFFKYFAMNFNVLGLKKLISTCYGTSPISYTQVSIFEEDNYEVNKNNGKPAYKAVLTEIHDQNGDGAIDLKDVELTLRKKGVVTKMKGDGDFRSEESIELLKEADIVVTNPPFSLFREYVAQLFEYDKKFIIIGNKNAVNYKVFFPYIMNNQVWIGYTPMSKDLLFDVPKKYADEMIASGKLGSSYRIIDGMVKGRSQSIWFTNLDHKKRHEKLDLIEKYTPEKYPTYDNYGAINVDKTLDIPCDYYGIMGVPISFLDKYCPEQFEILGLTCRKYSPEYCTHTYTKEEYNNANDLNGASCILVNGVPKMTYGRLLIKRKDASTG